MESIPKVKWPPLSWDPAPPIWELLDEKQQIEIAQAMLDKNVEIMKQQMNQLSKEIEIHQMTQDMIKRKK